MKKRYYTPSLSIVHIDASDLITSSPLCVGNGAATNSVMYGNSRNPIWDEDE